MATFGEELRRERELRSITLREVAQATKINLRYLEALEINDFEHLPGGLFNRGFVKAYAEVIGVDPEAMVNAYLLEEQSQAGQHGGVERRLLRRGTRGGHAPARPAAAKPAGRRARRVLIVVLVALALALTAWIVLGVVRDGAPGDEPPGTLGYLGPDAAPSRSCDG